MRVYGSQQEICCCKWKYDMLEPVLYFSTTIGTCGRHTFPKITILCVFFTKKGIKYGYYGIPLLRKTAENIQEKHYTGLNHLRFDYVVHLGCLYLNNNTGKW